jgi:hypothetical protein
VSLTFLIRVRDLMPLNQEDQRAQVPRIGHHLDKWHAASAVWSLQCGLDFVTFCSAEQIFNENKGEIHCRARSA